jgi:hypothetical protein
MEHFVFYERLYVQDGNFLQEHAQEWGEHCNKINMQRNGRTLINCIICASNIQQTQTSNTILKL